jgi:hypothetical protein
MAKASNKTKQTSVSPEEFIASVEHSQRCKDSIILLDFFSRVTGMKPKIWGSSIIGFGRYHYKYASGREGEHLVTGFSPRKSALTVYVMPGFSHDNLAAQMARLGKHKTGKSCIYISNLCDVDLNVLEVIVRQGVEHMQAKYQTWDE